MGKNLRQLSERRTNKGWIVVKRFKKMPGYKLALFYGATIMGVGWGFDSFYCATVFDTKKQAKEVVKKHLSEERLLDVSIEPVKDHATLIPEVNSKFKVFYRLEANSSLTELPVRVEMIEASARYHDKQVKKNLREARSYRRKAAILSKVNSRY